MSLISLQGVLRVAPIINGKPGKLLDMGNVPEATLALNQQSEDKTESRTGQRLQIGRLNTGRTCTLSGNLDEWADPRRLALGLYSAALDMAAGSVTGETLPAGLAVGDEVVLDRAFASDLALTDSAGSPVTVNVDHFELIGHAKNIVRMLNIAAYTQPFKAAYDYEAAVSLAIFTQQAPERWVVFDGINTETGEPILIDLYRGRFDPFQNVGLIHAGYGTLPFSIGCLADLSKADDATLGTFGRIRQKSA